VRLFNDNKFKKGSETYSTKFYTVESVVGKNVTLTNGKRVVDNNLLKVNDANLMIENGYEKPLNVIEEAHKETKIGRKIKQAGLVRPTFEKLNEARQSRGKIVDYAKLNKGK